MEKLRVEADPSSQSPSLGDPFRRTIRFGKAVALYEYVICLNRTGLAEITNQSRFNDTIRFHNQKGNLANLKQKFASSTIS